MIGSYLSDQVVLLRSRPIVYLHPAIHLKDTALLDRKADSFNMSVCVKYTGVNAPKTIGKCCVLIFLCKEIIYNYFIVVNILVDADHGESRGLVRGSSESLHRYETSLMLDTVTCEDLLIDLHVCMEEVSFGWKDVTVYRAILRLCLPYILIDSSSTCPKRLVFSYSLQSKE